MRKLIFIVTLAALCWGSVARKTWAATKTPITAQKEEVFEKAKTISLWLEENSLIAFNPTLGYAADLLKSGNASEDFINKLWSETAYYRKHGITWNTAEYLEKKIKEFLGQHAEAAIKNFADKAREQQAAETKKLQQQRINDVHNAIDKLLAKNSLNSYDWHALNECAKATELEKIEHTDDVSSKELAILATYRAIDFANTSDVHVIFFEHKDTTGSIKKYAAIFSQAAAQKLFKGGDSAILSVRDALKSALLKNPLNDVINLTLSQAQELFKTMKKPFKMTFWNTSYDKALNMVNYNAWTTCTAVLMGKVLSETKFRYNMFPPEDMNSITMMWEKLFETAVKLEPKERKGLGFQPFRQIKAREHITHLLSGTYSKELYSTESIAKEFEF